MLDEVASFSWLLLDRLPVDPLCKILNKLQKS